VPLRRFSSTRRASSSIKSSNKPEIERRLRLASSAAFFLKSLSPAEFAHREKDKRKGISIGVRQKNQRWAVV
jgi:hypothetical protein